MILRFQPNPWFYHARARGVNVTASSLDLDGPTPVAATTQPQSLAPVELEAALDRLSPVARSVLWLHEVEGYTHQEIGEMMGKTASFSKSQLSRAHQRLRELFR